MKYEWMTVLGSDIKVLIPIGYDSAISGDQAPEFNISTIDEMMLPIKPKPLNER
jgi:hypothetical protein